ncbi:MAG: AMP-binding protein, partial [Gammaproteobacteria bacterium]
MTQWTEDIISAEIAGTLDGLLCERVRRTPDTVAYRSYDAARKQWTESSWNDIGRATARWQAALAAEDLVPGERVALQLRNSKEWVSFDQAALACALVVVPLYTDDRPENIAYILRDSAARVLLVQDLSGWERLAPLLKDYEELKRVLILNAPESLPEQSGLDERVRFVPGWLPGEFHTLVRRPGDPHALASIVYTSGTTGRPKGVMLSHYNMLSIAHAALTMIDVYQEDQFLSFLPLSHTLERTAGYYLPMMTGSVVAYARSVPQLAEDLLMIRPTALIAVPRIFERVFVRIQGQLNKQSALARALFRLTAGVGWRRFEYQQQRAGWHLKLLAWPLLKRLVADKVTAKLGGRLRLTVSGGAALPVPVAKTFISLGVPILQGYGLTETSPVISVNLPLDNDPASVGVPLNGVEARIGEDDELLVKTPGRMIGYWNNHAATAEMIDPEGWLHTGD